ncbi:hypothetical protein, unknown function [Leishmania tarentolae]|uniref:Nudix hydrolase domain-containing protein n=1 Tax=Leishmania tarentolae TaxID=5689 RepID=A0A640KPS0_LEITA|nr:hypothetical protein, unknown function [Leishmania tarentolae]
MCAAMTPPLPFHGSEARWARGNANESSEKNVIIRAADSLAYRRSVQLFFVNEDGQFLIGCPVGESNKQYRQTVQGGSVEGETPMQTAANEAWEEIGLDLTNDASFLLEVLPPPTSLSCSGDSAGILASPEDNNGVLNKNGEIVSEYRAPFRYRTKQWRSKGIHGQEMYPFLFFLPRDHIHQLDVQASKRGVRQEFKQLYWGPLCVLEDQAPPVKKQVMSVICRAVAAAALPTLQCWRYPLDGIAAYMP